MPCASRMGAQAMLRLPWPHLRLSTRAVTQSHRYPLLLRQEMLRTIKSGGPMTVAEFMRMANTHPKYGYYTHKEVFGGSGDFVTSPEVTQVFGEVGRGSGQDIHLVELGPGRGTLMSDILRTFAQFEEPFGRIKRCTLVEASPRLMQMQEAELRPRFGNIAFSWLPTVDGVDCVPGETMVFFSNEFFDALPIHIFQRSSSGWSEVLVDALDLGTDATFRFIKSRGETGASRMLQIAERFGHVPTGGSIEVCPEAGRICARIADGLIKCGSGMMLAIDYGDLGESDGSLRAIKRHAVMASPLESVGECDISANVNFSHLSSCFPASRFGHLGPQSQGSFFTEWGIRHRLDSLLKVNSSDRVACRELTFGVDRIVSGDQMGDLYKVFAAIVL